MAAHLRRGGYTPSDLQRSTPAHPSSRGAAAFAGRLRERCVSGWQIRRGRRPEGQGPRRHPPRLRHWRQPGALSTEHILTALNADGEAPWAEYGINGLTARGLQLLPKD
ncbi:DUF3631 domain-containing protein [Kitasatospora sp. NPDC048194]|uniref:DUF3631 domain-containing protein n=1 Tax=Kitasatospora sp. NPDC048194 TaxID=3364045 RepID=UPI00371D0106